MPRAEGIVYCGCCEDSSRTNSDSNELVVLVSDETEDGGAVGSHMVGRKTEGIQGRVTESNAA